MPEKKIAFLGVRMPLEQKESIVAHAERLGLTISEYLRRVHVEAAGAMVSRAPAASQPRPLNLHVRHVDEIGPDPLWSGKRSLEV